MPSHLPSSFASAAAGQTRDGGRTGGRSDAATTRGSGSGEWSRRDGRTTNGTLTFRRSSTTPFNQSAPHASTDTPHTSAAEPPSSAIPQTPSFDASAAPRYSKEELLELFRASSDSHQPDISSLFAPGWSPGHVNGTAARPSWGKSGDTNHVAPDPGVCWDSDGRMLPVGLEDMTAEEKELFATDVNSPLKLPQVNKDGTAAGTVGQNGRKVSVSHGTTAGYGVSSPSTASRPGTRRRETTDTNPFPNSAVASPTASRFESTSWFSRKHTETKEPVSYEEPDDDNPVSRDQTSKTQPFAALNRTNTTGSSGFGAAPSIWGNSTAAVTPGLGAFGNFALPGQAAAEKRLGNTRGESRLAHLIPKDSADAFSPKSGEGANQDLNKSWRARPRTDTDPFAGDDRLSGSAVLGGSHDASPPPQPQGGSIFDTPVKGNTGDFGMSGLNLGGDADADGPASPSETNPYRSPAADRGDGEHDGSSGLDRSHHIGHGTDQASNFGSVSRAFGTTFEGSDRSQTSSVGAKGYPTLSNLTGWPAGPSVGTPDRDRPAFTSAFGSSLFSPVGDLQSPSLGGLGGGMFPGPTASNVSTTGSLRGSKLGSLFPASMQAQMQNSEQDSLSDSIPDLRQSNPLGAIGRGPIGMQPRDTESPLRSGRGMFEDLFPPVDPSRIAFTTGEQGLPGLTATSQGQSFAPTGIAPPFTTGQSSEQPTAQARTMVMPDRMRWVYLDPQGQTQGPFSGLEMNDWYKAQFFTPDLRVKKVEDPDFEPLGQLIRRIGNSREPFLVPQIGIPHGPPSQTGPFSSGDSRGVIPPLMGAFPSFGRTLTAEEQNNLERRKQEEQILMARQREFLAHQQAFSKIQMQPGAPGSLHHHSSAHSLQSQPSFGSITSPLGLGSQAPIGALGPNTGFFEPTGNLLQPTPPGGMAIGSDLLQQDLTPQERQTLASLQAGGALGSHFMTQPIGAPPTDAGLRSQLPGIDQLQNDSQGFSARLKEFQDIRAQRDAETNSMTGLAEVKEETVEYERLAKPASTATEQAIEVIQEVTRATQSQDGKRATVTQTQQQLSLTQQVQKTQAAAAAAAAAAAQASKQPETDDVWAKPSTSGLPMPFPPPSNTPLPAPTAQRQKSTLPTQFTSPSPTGTPDTLAEAAAPPPLAPWAPQPGIESHKGPSLKEIQEAEAKKAAKAEEAAAAARRAQLEQEAAALREREKASASVASGLPSTSTWGTGSPVNTPTASSPWAKPAAVKSAVIGSASAAATAAANERKKTLAEIQREEEARKQKARELAMQQGGIPAAAMGKRYADLASKTSAPPGLVGPTAAGAVPLAGSAPSAGSGWATVGAGGKVKVPTGPSTQARVASSTAVKTTPVPAAKPVAKPTNATTGSRDSGSDAMQEFHKWLHRELSRGLSGITDIEAFASNLLGFPLDASILADAVYANSTTMDGRHFGEEFVRRKRLADKGIVEKQPTPAPGADPKNNASGGWNEVAKKGSTGGAAPNKDEATIPGGQFKVVPGRKKGKK